MKTLILFLLLYIITPTLISQEIKVEFDNVIPRWYFEFNDTNFVIGSQSQINGKNSIGSIIPALVDENYGYIICNQSNGDGQFDGGPISKIRLTDGEIIWRNYFNTSNLDDQNFISYGSLSNELFLSGRKRTLYSKNNESSWSLGGYSLPFILYLNLDNGKMLGEFYDNTDSIGTFDVLVKYYLRNFKDKIFQMYRTGMDTLVWLQVEEFSKESGKVKEIQKLPFKHSFESEKFDKAKWYHFKHSDSVLITLFYYQSRDTTISSNVLGMEIYKLDVDSFKSYKYIDLKPYFKTIPQSTLADIVWVNIDKGGNILLSKTYQNKGENQVKCRVLKIDSDFKISSHFPEVRIDSLNHSYSALIPFYTDQSSIFLVAQPSATDLKGVDMIQLEKDYAPKIIGSLQTGSEKNKLNGILPVMDESGNIIITCGWDRQGYVVIGFHISDFGIKLSSTEPNKIKPLPLLSIFPNPSSNEVIFDISDNRFRTGTTYIYDVYGRLICQYKINDGDKMDVSNLISGKYIIHYQPDSRPEYFLTTKLIKP